MHSWSISQYQKSSTARLAPGEQLAHLHYLGQHAGCCVLCVRSEGHKVIVRLLNNEPKYLGLMLSAFQAWDAPTTGMTWKNGISCFCGLAT